MQPQNNPCRVLLGLHGYCTEGFFLKNLYCLEGTWRFGRTPDCLTSHACVPGLSHTKTCVFFSRKYPCFSLLNVTRRWSQWRPRRVKVETSVSTLHSRRATHCALLTGFQFLFSFLTLTQIYYCWRLRDREVAYSSSDRKGWNFELCLEGSVISFISTHYSPGLPWPSVISQMKD